MQHTDVIPYLQFGSIYLKIKNPANIHFRMSCNKTGNSRCNTSCMFLLKAKTFSYSLFNYSISFYLNTKYKISDDLYLNYMKEIVKFGIVSQNVQGCTSNSKFMWYFGCFLFNLICLVCQSWSSSCAAVLQNKKKGGGGKSASAYFKLFFHFPSFLLIILPEH